MVSDIPISERTPVKSEFWLHFESREAIDKWLEECPQTKHGITYDEYLNSDDSLSCGGTYRTTIPWTERPSRDGTTRSERLIRIEKPRSR